MSKFDDDFCEPLSFSDSTYVITGKITAEEAAIKISNGIGKDVRPDELHKDYVRFGFPPEHVEDRDSLGKSCWYTGAGKSKGTMPVWVYE